MEHRSLLTPREAGEYLRLNPRTVVRLAREGKIPAVRVGNRWRFRSESLGVSLAVGDPAVNTQATRARSEAGNWSIAALVRPECVLTKLVGTDRRQVLKELVAYIAQVSGLEDGNRLLELLSEREELLSTAMVSGVAIPHPRRTVPGMFAESLVFVALSHSGVKFAEDASAPPVKVFFVICATDDRSHLRILARLSRLLKDTRIAERLMCAGDIDDVISVIRHEEALVSGVR